MKQFRKVGFGLIVAAGLVMFGSGVATAQDANTPPADTEAPTTGSAENLANFLEALVAGSSAPDQPDTETDAAAIAEEETGSADQSAAGWAKIFEQLASGSGDATTPSADAGGDAG
ncbi:hypothetical protein [Nocardia sp. GTS18]|uniref:hypothetical protein n=1 Tax=Nocardia sp. GTS18 TaxID=1778064 RepID=UPI0015EEF061|nr:hypothetical protein [Nocardia sp. GTS18]